jgi:hypothetical protein
MYRLFLFSVLSLFASSNYADGYIDSLSEFVEKNGNFEQVITNGKGKKTSYQYKYSLKAAGDLIVIEQERKTDRPSIGPFDTYTSNHSIRKWETSLCGIYGYENKGKLRFKDGEFVPESNLVRISFFATKSTEVDLDKSAGDSSFALEEKHSSSADFYFKYYDGVFDDFLGLLKNARKSRGCSEDLEETW